MSGVSISRGRSGRGADRYGATSRGYYVDTLLWWCVATHLNHTPKVSQNKQQLLIGPYFYTDLNVTHRLNVFIAETLRYQR